MSQHLETGVRRIQKNIIALITAALLTSLLCGIVAANYNPEDVPNSLAITLYIINYIIGVAGLILSIYHQPVSLMQVHWTFYVIFFVLAPISQYLADYRCWGLEITDDRAITANFVVLIWGAVILLTSEFSIMAFSKRTSKQRSRKRRLVALPYCPQKTIGKMAIVGLTLLSAFSLVLLTVYIGGPQNLFSKSTINIDGNNTLQLVIGILFRAIPLFAFMATLLRFQTNNKPLYYGVVAIQGTIFLLTNFPASLARAVMAATYGGIAIALIKPLRRNNGLFILILIIGLLVIFPSINVFRKESFSPGLLLTAVGEAFSSIAHGFNFEDYDAYSLMIRCIEYVQREGATYGRELVSSALFFIPRLIWPGKMYGSGTILGEYSNLPWTRLSCPLPAEGLINFGVLGTVIFAICSGWLCAYFDINNRDEELKNRFFPFGLIFFFVLMRGELMSALAVLIGYFVTFIVLDLIAKLLNYVQSRISKKEQQ